MREILFRGKRRDNGKWWYGSYLFLHVKPMDWTGMRVGKVEDVHYIVDETDLNYAVDPATVGQYTGLTDKNGKKIFEGDIVRGYNTFHEREEQYVSSWESNGFYLFDDCGSGWHPEHIAKLEVIGNIHDNPELLKGANDAEIH